MPLVFNNVSYKLGDRLLLRQLTLAVQPGELVTILGPNGAGKSTLLKLASGELEPSNGTVYLGNREVRHWPQRALACQRAVLAQQNSATMPLNVEDVIALGRLPHDTGLEENYQLCCQVMHRLGITQLFGRRFMTLSGGEQQRVRMAKVLVQLYPLSIQVPRYLFLDEPTSALDIANQYLLMQLAQELTRHNVGVVIILHDINLALNYSSRVILLRKGEVLADAHPSHLLGSSLLSTLYEVPMTVEHGHNQRLVCVMG
jgi:iron complex transport system ATP-binding protein